jgi:unspecific monooxygenase
MLTVVCRHGPREARLTGRWLIYLYTSRAVHNNSPVPSVNAMTLLATLSAVPLVLLALLWWYLHVPFNLPRLPRIPFYVSILGLWSSMGQDEIYERWLRKPLEDHGAALLWFAGQWSILVTRPDLLTDMFRNEELYAKAGSQVKIPWSVIASLVGDNIINSHGENWRLYTAVMKPGMQKKSFDTGLLRKKSRRLVDRLLEKQTAAGREGILVNALVQKYAVDVMGENFLDLDFGVSLDDTL